MEYCIYDNFLKVVDSNIVGRRNFEKMNIGEIQPYPYGFIF